MSLNDMHLHYTRGSSKIIYIYSMLNNLLEQTVSGSEHQNTGTPCQSLYEPYRPSKHPSPH